MNFLEKELGGSAKSEYFAEVKKYYFEGRPEVNVDRMKQYWERKLQARAPSPSAALLKYGLSLNDAI